MQDVSGKPARRGETRRVALGGAGAIAAAGVAGAASAQGRPRGAPIRLPDPPPVRAPRKELVSVLQYEDEARLALGAEKLAPVAGSDRTVTDRITLRPRINIPTGERMDLTCRLFGDDHFAPIIVGPMADQRRFHSEGEVAIARGASAAKAGMVVSSQASLPLHAIAEAATTPLWVQVDPRRPAALAEAREAKARAIVVTINTGTPVSWGAVEAIVKATPLPVIVKGVTQPREAREAVARGAQGVVVSNYRGGAPAGLPGTLLLIEPVVQAVGDRVAVFADGSFRYGTDVLKALGFGAKAVLIGRPVSWGLAAYGDDGVQGVVETLQTDLARIMGMCGRPTLASINSSVVRVHPPVLKVATR